MSLLLLLSLPLLLAGCGASLSGGEPPLTDEPRDPSTPSTQEAESFSATITVTVGYKYLVFLPKGYDSDTRAWPLMLFLHGSGERGDDLELVKRHGPPKIVETHPEFPFIVVSPQCPAYERWSADALNALLDHVEKEYRVDTDRVYLTGLSMGGFGAWALAMAHPERFAAVAPICGAGDPQDACRLKDVPIWAFHGAKDPVVPLAEQEATVDAVRACGGDIKFTIYPGATHNSWSRTYRNPQLYRWFLSHSLKERTSAAK